MQITINKALTYTKAMKSRLADLEKLRSEVAKKETYFGNENKQIEPQYDVKAVDKMVAELQRMIFEIDSSVKESNAKTELDVAIDPELIFKAIS